MHVYICMHIYLFNSCISAQTVSIATEHQHTTSSLGLDPVSAKVLLIKVSPPAVDHALV